MEINQDGSLKVSEQRTGELNNHEIVWLYLSTYGAYLARKEEIKSKLKQAKALEAMLLAMADDDSQKETVEKVKEKVTEMISEVEEKNLSEEKYMISVYTNLRPKFFMIKDSAHEIVDEIVNECFNGESKIIQKILAESEDSK